MTREELAQHDGREGRKAYVAVSGKVYDFTGSALWREGDHQGMHRAGCDLSEELRAAPHVRAVVERFPVVGELEEAAPSVDLSRYFRIVALAGAVLLVLGILFFLKK